jgi:hypothetical protein
LPVELFFKPMEIVGRGGAGQCEMDVPPQAQQALRAFDEPRLMGRVLAAVRENQELAALDRKFTKQRP